MAFLLLVLIFLTWYVQIPLSPPKARDLLRYQQDFHLRNRVIDDVPQGRCPTSDTAKSLLGPNARVTHLSFYRLGILLQLTKILRGGGAPRILVALHDVSYPFCLSVHPRKSRHAGWGGHVLFKHFSVLSSFLSYKCLPEWVPMSQCKLQIWHH